MIYINRYFFLQYISAFYDVKNYGDINIMCENFILVIILIDLSCNKVNHLRQGFLIYSYGSIT